MTKCCKLVIPCGTTKRAEYEHRRLLDQFERWHHYMDWDVRVTHHSHSRKVVIKFNPCVPATEILERVYAAGTLGC